MPLRRDVLAGAAALALPGLSRADTTLDAALRRAAAEGGVVMLRHALAPGTFDPPGFRLGDCRTQRNLSDEGRTQAQRLGAALTARGLRPVRVRSSPWCRCLDTARLAFGAVAPVEPWAALGSPHGQAESTNAQSLAQLREALAARVAQRGGVEVWVSHMFVFNAWLGESPGSGDGVVLGLAPDGAPRLAARVVGLGS